MKESDKENLLLLMKNSPQQWTIDSIIHFGFGEKAFYNGKQACLYSNGFYYIEGSFDTLIAEEIQSKMEFPAIITSSDKQWYSFFEQQSSIASQLVKRCQYVWNGNENHYDRYCSYLEKEGFSISLIDKALGKKIDQYDWAEGIFDAFGSLDSFLKNGFGYCVLHNEKPVSVCTTFSFSHYGVEIEVDTDPEYQGQGWAKCVAAHFIQECVKRDVKPLWDSSNPASEKLARSLGFDLIKEYEAYQIE